MGLISWLNTPAGVPKVANHSSLADLIIADALQNGGYRNLALAVASVFRARSLNAAVPARLPVLAGGVQLSDTQDRMTEIILSLQDHGDAYLKVLGRDFEVLRFDHVQARWADDQRTRLYLSRDGVQYRTVATPGIAANLVVLSVNRGAEDLTGMGWMESKAVQNAIAVTSWAREYFENNADPTGHYHVGAAATKQEMDLFRKQVESRNAETGVSRSPLFTSGAIEWTGHSFDAQSSQWVESAERAALDISALSGVPAQFLSVALSGSNLTYTTQDQLWQIWWQQTALEYVSKIEAAWSGIMGVDVKIDPESLLISSMKDRVWSASELVRTGFDPAASLDEVGMPPIEHTGAVSVNLQQETPA